MADVVSANKVEDWQLDDMSDMPELSGSRNGHAVPRSWPQGSLAHLSPEREVPSPQPVPRRSEEDSTFCSSHSSGPTASTSEHHAAGHVDAEFQHQVPPLCLTGVARAQQAGPPPRPLALRPVARAPGSAWPPGCASAFGPGFGRPRRLPEGLPESWTSPFGGGSSSSSASAPAPASPDGSRSTAEDAASDAGALLEALRLRAEQRREAPFCNKSSERLGVRPPRESQQDELAGLRRRLASMEEALNSGGGGFAAPRSGVPELHASRGPGLSGLGACLGLSALLSEAEEEAQELQPPQLQARPRGAVAVSEPGEYRGDSPRHVAALREELACLQRRHASTEVELEAVLRARLADEQCLEARTAECEGFARACAEALQSAGAAQAEAAFQSREVEQRCRAELAAADLLPGLSGAEFHEEREKALALQQQNLAQDLRHRQCLEELSRMRDWSDAFEATAKAEAVAAHRLRSELAEAVQGFWHSGQPQQHGVPQSQASAVGHRAALLRLEPIPEASSSSRECSSAGSCSPGRDDAVDALDKEAVELASQEADRDQKQEGEEEEALVSQLRRELAATQAEKKAALGQRDKAELALMELQQEHAAMLLALRRGARLPPAAGESPGSSSVDMTRVMPYEMAGDGQHQAKPDQTWGELRESGIAEGPASPTLPLRTQHLPSAAAGSSPPPVPQWPQHLPSVAAGNSSPPAPQPPQQPSGPPQPPQPPSGTSGPQAMQEGPESADETSATGLRGPPASAGPSDRLRRCHSEPKVGEDSAAAAAPELARLKKAIAEKGLSEAIAELRSLRQASAEEAGKGRTVMVPVLRSAKLRRSGSDGALSAVRKSPSPTPAAKSPPPSPSPAVPVRSQLLRSGGSAPGISLAAVAAKAAAVSHGLRPRAITPIRPSR
ncbi:unnamed protein product [Polarella glacialis]|uniref:Uncharacterized protein n=1 Tax=Polarella glacialis TaxID=89957 RepID=A0A813M912_POLGL|nr:unnamed protein product [Polarella glacialis]CAE8743985.1 unnamed protein product [Polarella glacialis]